MELKEGLEVLCEMCQSRKECDGCPLYINDCDEDDEMCELLCNGFDIDLICKTAEQAKKQAKKSMTVKEAVEYVKSHLDERTKLEQLAEEANELSQAALKLIRAKGMSDNATPVTADKALDNLQEEVVDVLACLVVLDVDLEQALKTTTANLKWLRWANRLRAKKHE